MSAAHPQAGGFLTTRWTQVLAARGGTQEARLALRDLCEACYAPVELFVRRQVGTEDARDLTHEFFARLLELENLGNPDPARGRFRTYLLGAVKHFLADRRDHEGAQRRGGGQPPQSLDESNCPPSNPDDTQADASFDRQWALAVVEGSIETLRQEPRRPAMAHGLRSSSTGSCPTWRWRTTSSRLWDSRRVRGPLPFTGSASGSGR